MSGYEHSGMTRQQYCDLHGIPVSTFAYHRRRIQERQPKSQGQQLVRVEVSRPEQQSSPGQGFVLTLARGRRIESPWNFGEQELMRLIRIVEAA